MVYLVININRLIFDFCSKEVYYGGYIEGIINILYDKNFIN